MRKRRAKKAATKRTPKRKPSLPRMSVKKRAGGALAASGGFRTPSPIMRGPSPGTALMAVGIGSLVLGGLALATDKRPKSPESRPISPPPPPPSTPDPPPPPPQPVLPKPPTEFWSPNNKTLNRLEGFKRAKTKELNREIVERSPDFLRFNMGPPVHLHTTADGTEYAVALEEHTDDSKNDSKPHPHKGVSIFRRIRA